MGGTHGDSWIVTKGLEKGEQVVVEGTQRVRGGIAVKLGKLSATSS